MDIETHFKLYFVHLKENVKILNRSNFLHLDSTISFFVILLFKYFLMNVERRLVLNLRQGSISSTFYEQLFLPELIPKAQKDTDDLNVLCFWELHSLKLCVNMWLKSIPGADFTNILQAAFTCADPKSAKRH